MNQRIKFLRKSLGLTLKKFGECVGVSEGAVSNIEKGYRNVTEQMFKSICREFNVNEEWLRDGVEPMFIDSDTFSLDEFAKSKGATNFDIALAKAYFSFSSQTRTEIQSKFSEYLSQFFDNSNFTREASKYDDLYESVPDTPEELERICPPVPAPHKEIG